MNGMALEYSLSSILPFVRQSLQGRGDFSYANFVWAVFSELENAGIPEIVKTPIGRAQTGQPYLYSEAPHQLRFALCEAFCYLLRNGFLIPKPPHGAPLEPSHIEYILTGRGLEWVKGVEPLPEDMDGYMKALKNLVPNLDAIVEQYIAEALTAFDRGAFFAAAVMVGAAAEKGIYILAESMSNLFVDVAKNEKLKKLIERRKLNELFNALKKNVEDAYAAKVLPYAIFEGASTHMLSWFEAIRVQRNDAVHPANAAVSPDAVRLSLHSFPHAMKKTEELRRWFSANPKSV